MTEVKSILRLTMWQAMISVCTLGLLATHADPNASTAVERLIKASRIYDQEEMARASWALSKIGTPAIPALLRAMEDFDDNVRWQSIVAMGRIGYPGAKDAIPTVVKALKDVDPDVRGAAAVALGLFQQRTAPIENALRTVLKDEHGMVRADAYWAIWKLTGDKDAIPVLIKLLSEKDWMVTHAATSHLADIGKPAVPQLIAYLKKPGAKGRDLAVKALAQMAPPPPSAIVPLISCLSESDALVYEAAVHALGRMSNPAVEPLIRLLNTGEERQREGAARALGMIGAPAAPAVPHIIEHLKKRSDIRIPYIDALGGVGSHAVDAVPLLLSLLRHAVPDVRSSAASALGKIGPGASAATTSLREVATSDESDFVRASAREALRRLATTPDQ